MTNQILKRIDRLAAEARAISAELSRLYDQAGDDYPARVYIDRLGVAMARAVEAIEDAR
jgi:hypothetical protein